MSDIHYDMHGVPIYKGDLIRFLHFIGSRNKKHYLYHTVVEANGKLMLVPTSHLEPTKANDGGICPLDAFSDSWAAEVISGYGPEPYLSYDERPKRKDMKVTR
jgi:hypothetical protein